MNKSQNFSTSVWNANNSRSRYPELKNDLEVDIAIVGAGITGITAAYLLAKEGKSVAVLEAHKVGNGSTAFSTGNLYATVGERLSSIEKKHGQDVMLEVVRSRNAAIDFIEQTIANKQIDCEFKRVPWHLFSTERDTEENSEIQEEFSAGRKAGLPGTNTPPVGFHFSGISEIATFDNQAQLNPYTYVLALASLSNSLNCKIHEGTTVTKVEDGNPCIVHTTDNQITAKQVIMATHSPKGIYQVQTEMQVYREFALAAKLKEPLPNDAIYWNLTSSGQYSIRPYSNEEGAFLIVLGDPYRVATLENNDDCLQHIEQYLRRNFQVESIVYRWAAQNYKSGDGLPYIGMSALERNTYIATGFKADGLVYGTLAAMLISDAILGKEHPWLKLYSPTRFTPIASAKQFAKESFTVANHLLKDYLWYGEVDSLKQIEKGQGKTLTIDGEKIAAYRDADNKLHLVSSVCTHLGCIVHFNTAEKSWDCPCHGSRFTIDGEVIEGPAYKNLPKPL